MRFTYAVLAKLQDYEWRGLWNIAATALDIHANLLPKVDSGFRLEERQALGAFMASFQDCFRVLHPDKVSYTTWWTPSRAGDHGFRFDGVLVSKGITVLDAEHIVWPMGSDHIPASVVVRWGKLAGGFVEVLIGKRE
ncbi:hypothetical protein BDR26DRAFT_890443 [Obelidium mucronatum]|nr:hypothetical protein BDR26DRAFT_890443 [Obelidium mucronatum]